MASEKKAPAGGEPAFDERLRRLEAIVLELESGAGEGAGLGLEASIERYREGVALLKGCRELLAGYRKQVEELSQDAAVSARLYAGDPDVGASG